MKIKIDKATAEHTRDIISYGLGCSHGNILITLMLHEQLQPFADVLYNPWNRKTKTLNVNYTLAACLHTVYKCANDVPPLEASRLIMTKYVMEPIAKQVKEG